MIFHSHFYVKACQLTRYSGVTNFPHWMLTECKKEKKWKWTRTQSKNYDLCSEGNFWSTWEQASFVSFPYSSQSDSAEWGLWKFIYYTSPITFGYPWWSSSVSQKVKAPLLFVIKSRALYHGGDVLFQKDVHGFLVSVQLLQTNWTSNLVDSPVNCLVIISISRYSFLRSLLNTLWVHGAKEKF